jgi:hypothetical protein
MPKIKFSGSSDDNFQIDGAIHDEIGCYDSKVVLLIKNPDGECLRVVGEYGTGDVGCWMIGLQPLEGGQGFPSWDVEFSTASNKYSYVLSLDVPPATTITQLYPKEDEDCPECGRPYEPQKWVVK